MEGIDLNFCYRIFPTSNRDCSIDIKLSIFNMLFFLGFTTLFNILGHQRHSDLEREKSDKFCSEALISAWGSFTCRKSTTRDPRLYFPSEGSHTPDFYALKKSIDHGRVWTREPRIQRRVWKTNHGTTWVDLQQWDWFLVARTPLWTLNKVFSVPTTVISIN